jgi:excisionase family DNA binding protein
MNLEQEGLMTTAEIAEQLRVSTRQVSNLVSRRIIPRIKVGRTVRFQLSSVLKALAKYEEQEYGR